MSMNVHSLIDKFSKEGEKSDRTKEDTRYLRSGREIKRVEKRTRDDKTDKTDQREGHDTKEESGSAPKDPGTSPTLENTGLLSLLGPQVSAFPFSEQAFIETVRLRAEQERTKQEFYRLEIATKNLSILQGAVRAQVPPSMIPSMFGEAQREAVSKMAHGHDPPRSPVRGHSRSASLAENTLNASAVPPQNFRFGSPRPHSPAKIGAAAVANLATPVTPYRRRYHQRTYSMPERRQQQQQGQIQGQQGQVQGQIQGQIQQQQVQQQQQQSSSSSQQSQIPHSSRNPSIPHIVIPPIPSGTFSRRGGASPAATMQVKPAPALPLHKQTKQPPSQESMTSFQHVIQFHHWKPEEPGPAPGPAPVPPGPFRHKRHKSDMSIDLGSPARVDKKEDEKVFTSTPLNAVDPLKEYEVTMDLEDTTISERVDESVERRGSNVGRFPHDILHTPRSD